MGIEYSYDLDNIQRFVEKHDDGSYKVKFKDAVLRLSLPEELGSAMRYHRADGSISSEDYWINGVIHRRNGPASTEYYPDGTISCELYFVDGNITRRDGPAIIYYNEDGSVRSHEHYYLGVHYEILDSLEVGSEEYKFTWEMICSTSTTGSE